MNRIEKLNNFLKQNPGDSFLKHALALEYVKSGADAEARNLFEEILEQKPDYVGSYYHLGKLLERQGLEAEAIKIFEDGMEQAKAAGDNHAFNELRAAHEELTI